MSRREADRREREREADYPRKQPARETVPPKPRIQLDEFWLDGQDIDRQVLQSSICRFLGSEATCRPYEYNGKPGYKIRAIRTFTPDMLDDLKNLSKEFMQENRTLRTRNREEVRYEESQTRIRRDLPEFDDYPRDNRSYGSGPSTSSYTMSSPGYSDQSMSGYNPSVYPSGQYSGGHPYTMASAAGGVSAYSDPRYPTDYSYPPVSRDAPPAGYGYPSGAAYVDPSRTRPDVPPGYFPTAGGPPPPRSMMEDPSRYPYDSMTGIQPSGAAYGVPHRGQNPSPYEPVPRDAYARPPPESYGVSRRR